MNTGQLYILARIKKEPNGCWTWLRFVSKNGYGQLKIGNKCYKAHRYSYAAFVGQIPDGKELDHLCRNRKCVNPKHLEAVTRRENSLRGYGVSGINARKTYAKCGHKFNKTLHYANGETSRVCLPCMNKRINIGKKRRRKNPVIHKFSIYHGWATKLCDRLLIEPKNFSSHWSQVTCKRCLRLKR